MWLHSNSKNWEKDSRLWLAAECKSWRFFFVYQILTSMKAKWRSKQTRCISTETCVDRCGSFNPQSKCQCDSMCVYYGSCCEDFDTVCPKKSRCKSRTFLYLHISQNKRGNSQLFFMQHNRLPQFPVATPSVRWRTFQKRRRLPRPRQPLHQLSAQLQQLALPLPISLLHPSPTRALLSRPWTPTQPPAAAVRLMPFCSWRMRRSMHSEVNIELTKDRTSGKKTQINQELAFFLQRGVFFRVGWRVHPPRISQTNPGRLGNPRAHRRCIHAHQLSWKILHL